MVSKLEDWRDELSVIPLDSFGHLPELKLHPKIAEMCIDLYKKGSYPEAVFAACKALVLLVKGQSKSPKSSNGKELDGVPLMETVFSPENPLLAFNDLKGQTDRDEQKGMMQLFAGVVAAFKNPGSHAFPVVSAEQALQCIGFLSLLAARLDDAKMHK